MSELKGPPGELRMTVTIKRKATGKVETVELVGHAVPEPKQEEKEPSNGGNSHDGGA
jgi:hypothetical protein